MTQKSRVGIFLLFSILLSSSLFQTIPAQAATLSASNATELIAAINVANASPEADIIHLTNNIILNDSNFANDLTDGVNGLPSIASEIIINGNGFTISRDPASTPFRIFHVSPGANLWLHDVTVTGGLGSGSGGGIFARGENFNTTTLTLTNSIVTLNEVYTVNSRASGAGIAASYTNLTILNSQITNNSINNGELINGTGLAVYDGRSYVIRSSISENTATLNRNLRGGGLSVFGRFLLRGSEFNLYESHVDNNTSTGLDTNPIYRTSIQGAGIYTSSIILNIMNSSVNGNRGYANTSRGGGIHVVQRDFRLNVNASTIDNNVLINTATSGEASGGGLFGAEIGRAHV